MFKATLSLERNGWPYSSKNEILTREELLNELLLVEEHIESLGLPKVFCHNEPSTTNQIYNKETGLFYYNHMCPVPINLIDLLNKIRKKLTNGLKLPLIKRKNKI